MLKACWDCIAGDQRQTDDPYRIHLNGGSRAPPWQTPDQTMFLMPTRFNANNEIIIRGEMASDGRLNLSLRNDSGIIFTLDVHYPLGGQNEDKIDFNPKRDNEEDFIATDYFEEPHYIIRFKVLQSGLSIFVGESHLSSVQLNSDVEDIKYLSINGQLKELSFKFD